MRLGALARALEAAIDKNLGIDADQASAALQSAHKEEGSLLDTALGKQASSKFKESTGKLADRYKKKPQEEQTESPKERAKSGPRKVPTPDDFFSDFGIDHPPAKGGGGGELPAKPPNEVEADASASAGGGMSPEKKEGAPAKAPEPAAVQSKPAPAAEAPEAAPAAMMMEEDEMAYFASSDVVVDEYEGGVEQAGGGFPEEVAAPKADEGGVGGHEAPTHAPEPAPEPEATAQREEEAPVAARPPEPVQEHGANGVGGGGADAGEVARLRDVVAQREKELMASKTAEAESQGMIEKLRAALSKSGQILQQVTIENEDKVQECEGQWQREKERADKAEKALAELKNASKSAAEAAEQLAQVKDEKEGLMKEGQKLMQEKQSLEAVIKQLRKQLKEKEEQMLKLRESEEECRLLIGDLENQLDEAGLSSKTTEEAMAQIRGMSHETAKKLQEREKDKQQLLAKNASLEKQVATLTAERDAAQKRADEAMKDAEEEGKRIVDRERRLIEKEATLKVEMLTDSLEGLQAAMRRLELQSAAKEQRLKEDLNDMQQRCADAEGRCQELSSAVPDSTRPLLRQLESLQQGFGEKQRIWEQVEANLRQRSTEAEQEARAAVERERIAQERLKQHVDNAALLEARVAALQGENARLGAEQRAAREEAESARRALQDANAELEVHQGAAARRAQEILDNKALHRRLMMEEADKFALEREAWVAEKEELLRRAEASESLASERQSAPGSVAGDVGGVEERGGYGEVKFGIGRDGKVADPWEKLAGKSPFGYERTNQDGQVAALQQRCSALERERDSLAEELGYQATHRQRLERDAGEVGSLRKAVEELEKQQELALELLGAREEEIDDLKTTIEEQKEVFRQTLQASTAAAGSS